MSQEEPINSPVHYSSLSLRNFRGFKRADAIKLAPLTFLVGPNSSGKSSIFDALLLVTQSQFAPWIPTVQKPSWGGPLVDLGSYKDTVYGHNTNLVIEIGLEISEGLRLSPVGVSSARKETQHPIGITFAIKDLADDPIGQLANIEIHDPLTDEQLSFRYVNNRVTMEFLGRKRTLSSLRVRHRMLVRHWITREIREALSQQPQRIEGRKAAWQRIQEFVDSYAMASYMNASERVSSGRAAPKRWYAVTDIKSRPNLDIYGPKVFDTVDPNMIADPQGSEQRALRTRKIRRLSKDTITSILRELEIASQIKDSQLSPYHSSISVKDSVTGVMSNLIDVGYGASQVIPILYACFDDSDGPLFIEQPEIHLHPKAQGTVANLLCQTSRNRQVVVETHSVHMINRARILVAKGELSAKNVMVNYVERGKSGSRVFPIPILDNGDFGSEWPEGFFDERYEDTLLLLKLKSEGKR